MILLDTCVLLWLASDTAAISKVATAQIRNTSDGLFVSAITAFEVGQKAAAGKLTLPQPVDVWFSEMMEWHGLREMPVDAKIAAQATLLPSIHRDPFDRILIATAQVHNFKLLTPDPTIASYPNVKTIW